MDSGALTGTNTAGIDPFLHDTGVLAGTSLAAASTCALFVGLAAAESQATLRGAAIREALATTAIAGVTALSADPTDHVEGAAPGHGAAQATAGRIVWVLGRVAGRSVAYGFLAGVGSVLTGHTDLIGQALQTFAMWGYVEASLRAQASGLYGRRNAVCRVAGGSTVSALLGKLQMTSGTAAGRGAAAANPAAVPADALMDDNESSLTGKGSPGGNSECDTARILAKDCAELPFRIYGPSSNPADRTCKGI